MSWRSSERGRRVLSLCGLAIALGCGDGGGEAGRETDDDRATTRPLNILLLTLDTTRADALGAYGQERPLSPHIDRLSSEGVLFEQAYTSAPNTLPAHATILTGRMPFAHGVRSNAGYQLAPEVITLAEVLSERGYVTAAEVAAPVIGRHTGIDQGFAQFRDTDSPDAARTEAIVRTADGAPPRRIELFERSAVEISRRGVEFLSRNRDRPFFLWLHYFDPHRTYSPPAPWKERFPDSPYHGEIHFMDAQVGSVLDALRALSLAEHTLVVLTADHGEGLGEHGEQTHSMLVYDTTMRVPLIFTLPGVLPAGRRVASPVRTSDIAPTALALAGLPPLPGVQGISLESTLRGADAPALDAYGESFESHTVFGGSSLRFLRRGRWKYIHKSQPELYDLVADPAEREDLAAREPERVAELAAHLGHWVRAEAAAPADALQPVDPETRSQLVALGYAGAAPTAPLDDAADLAAPTGPDPDDLADAIERYADASASITAQKYGEAMEKFAALHEEHPESLAILRGFVKAADGAGQLGAAVPLLRRALLAQPDAVELHVSLGRALLEQKALEEAERVIRAGLSLEACESELRVLLSAVLDRAGRTADQLAALQEGIDACELSSDVQNDYAYVRATAKDPEIRDGAEALRIARKLVAESGDRPDYLDTLACAHAATGDYRRAEELAREAIRQLETRGVPEEVIALYREHRERFARKEPVIEGP